MRRFAQGQSPPESVTSTAATPCVGGFAGIYPCSNVDLLAHLSLADLSAGAGNDSWGWTDAFDGKEYALMGLNNGTAFVDISDPENPVYLGKLPTHTVNSSWRDMKVYADHAFIVSEASGHGMQVFDLTQLRNVVNPPVTFSNTAHYSQFGNAHNIAINEDSGYAYAVGTSTCSGGLHMVNIQTPTSPTNAGCFSSDGYTHDAQCVTYTGPDVTYQGQEICFNANEDTLTIVDVTNKAAPVQVSRTPYAGSGYTHQGWLTEDQSHFLLDDELDESNNGHNTRTYIWDVSDLDVPVLIGNYTAAVAAIDHNLYTKGNYAYEANYRSGLRILDISDVANANLSEAAFFDTYPASNSAAFSGAWSTYPYFDSGVVIISDINSGLFIVRPNLAGFGLSVEPPSLEICQGTDAVYTVTVSDNGSTAPVTLSAIGVPAGANYGFSVNPVIPTATSDLIITNTAAVALGSYDIDIVGSNITDTLTTTVNLSVADVSPGVPSLLTPPDGATGVNTTPTLEWSAASGASSYLVEIATDSGFSTVVYTATESSTSHLVGITLDTLTTYYWRVTGSNACGTGSTSSTFSFTTRDTPPILLVDDDDNSPDVRAFYTDALDNLGLSYDVWDTVNSDNEPNASQLQPYSTVIWFTGDEFGGAAGPGAAGEAALGSWLDDGNCLFISSQDYYYDRGLTSFMDTYLGVASATSDVGQATVTGAGTVFSGLGPYALSYPFTNWSDIVNADGAPAEVAFTGDQGNAAVNKDSGTYRTTFWGFPWEAIPTAGARETAMQTFLDWCGGGGGSAPVIEVAPGALAVSQGVAITSTQTLSISNSGDANLTWIIDEDDGGPIDGSWGDDFSQVGLSCTMPSDIPWLSLSPTEGTTVPGATSLVDVTFDSTGLAFGQYTGSLCVSSDDPLTPLVTVPLTLTVTPSPGISLVKTVGTTPGVCASTTDITVDAGTVVYYCYEVTNTGNITLTLHNLADSALGALMSGLGYDLAPGASVDTVAAGLTVSATITTTTVNTATWTAYNAGPTDEATAVASASVTVADGFFIYLPVIMKP